MEDPVNSVGLEGIRGHRLIVESNARSEKEACIIIVMPDTTMTESKERILSFLHTRSIHPISSKMDTTNLQNTSKEALNHG